MISTPEASGQTVPKSESIAIRPKLVALADTGLAALFYLFFMFTKHDPQLRTIIPFGEDPYDAVGSFCMIFSILLAALCLVRAFRPYRKRRPTPLTQTFLARAEAAIPAGILIAAWVDAIAMARHPSQWVGKSATAELAALVAGMAAISLLVLFPVHKITEFGRTNLDGHAWRAIFVGLSSSVVLFFFPESLMHSIPFHLFAIVLGFLLIAAPQQAAVVALVPLPVYENTMEPASEHETRRAWTQWIGAALAGAAIGAFAVAGEILNEDSGKMPVIQMLMVSAIFVGSGMAALLVGLGFFKKPLGLFRDDSIAIPVGDRSTNKGQKN